MEFKIRCEDFVGAEIKRRAAELGSSINFYFLAAALGKISVKKFKQEDVSEAKTLRGLSRPAKNYWRMIQNWLDDYQTNLYGGRIGEFEQDFGDLMKEAFSLLESGSEYALQEFINTGKLRIRKDEILERRRLARQEAPASVASDLFERVDEGRLE